MMSLSLASTLNVAFGALGIVGVATQLFQSRISIYRLLSEAQNLSADAPVALWKLKIQESGFIVWGHYGGIESWKT